ncbi:MAG: hypothetical protein KY476_16020, partial [Planctomycetes bacterium]|nr:hypothetical protein [Planctomycetota bacterium]
QPRQGDTYIADRRTGTLQIDLDDEDSDAVADSLTRLEQERNRLDTLIQRPRQREREPDTTA